MNSIWRDPSTSHVYCCRHDGTLAEIDTSTQEDQTNQVVGSVLLNNNNNNSRTSSSRPNAASSPPPRHLASKSTTHSIGPSNGPEFQKSKGYRGPIEGYLYREGTLGNGYYRSDVMRKYTQGVVSTSTSTTATSSDVPIAPVAAAVAAVSPFVKQIGVRFCARSPTSELIATASDDPNDGNVIIWSTGNNTATGLGAIITTLRGHSAGVLCLTFSHDGSLLFTGSYDQTVRVWDTSTWILIKVLKGHGGGIRALAVSGDGRSLYSAAADNTIRAWNIGTWVCLRLMHGRHEDTTWPACMVLHTQNNDEKNKSRAVLITGSTGPFGGSTLKAFDPSTGECLATFAQLGYEQRGGVSAVAIAPSGDIVYSSASDGTVAAWSLEWQNNSEIESKTKLRKGFFG